MNDTQVFVWKKEQVIATLEVRHHRFEMVLNVIADFAETVRAKMVELNEGGMYPNEETTSEDSPFIQFIISGGYNWNARWRDFRTTLDEMLGVHSVEKQD